MLHKQMKGGLQGDSETGLTAYVALSLLEANVSRTVGSSFYISTEPRFGLGCRGVDHGEVGGVLTP